MLKNLWQLASNKRKKVSACVSDNPRKKLGTRGELAVIDFLEKDGYRILVHSYKTRTGEIDIIMQKHDVIAFVEVKSRMHHYDNFCMTELVGPVKQQKIIKTAARYIALHKLSNHILRFDVALVTMQQDAFHIKYIANAFTA